MKTVIRIATSLTAATLLAAPLAIAHEVPDTGSSYTQDAPNTAQGKDVQPKPEFKLPSQDEIAALKEQLPDMTAMMGDMMGLMKDDEFKKGMMGSLDAFKEHVDPDTFSKTQDGMPDMTAMMGAMLDVLGDEDLMNGLVQQFGPMKEMMEKHIPAEKSPEPDWQ